MDLARAHENGKPGILPFQRPIRFIPETDNPRPSLDVPSLGSQARGTRLQPLPVLYTEAQTPPCHFKIARNLSTCIVQSRNPEGVPGISEF
jgi:hypothetical protein